MNKRIFILFVIISFTYSFQVTQVYGKEKKKIKVIVKENGQISPQYPKNKCLKKKQYPIIETTALQEWNRKTISATKRSIADQLDKAIENLQKTDNDGAQFYNNFLSHDIVANVSRNILNIRNKLNNPTYIRDIFPPSPYAILDSFIYSLASQFFYSIDTLVTGETITISIKKSDPYKMFKAGYYNKLISEPENAIVAKYNKVSDFDNLKTTGEKAKSKLEQLKVSQLAHPAKSIYELNLFANNYLQIGVSPLERYFDAPWLLQWIWYTNGQVNTTPLGYTDDNKLRVKPEVNKEKADKMKNFINKLDLLYQNDTAYQKDVIKYKQTVLDYSGKEEAMFTDSTKMNDLISKNKSTREGELNYRDFSGQFKIPYKKSLGNTKFLNFASSNQKINANIKEVDPLTVDQKVIVVVNNVSQNHQITLNKVYANPFKDISPVTATLNDNLTTIFQAATSLTSLSFVSSWIGLNTNIVRKPPLQNYILEEKEISAPAPVEIEITNDREQCDSVWNALRIRLNKYADGFKDRYLEFAITGSDSTILNFDPFSFSSLIIPYEHVNLCGKNQAFIDSIFDLIMTDYNNKMVANIQYYFITHIDQRLSVFPYMIKKISESNAPMAKIVLTDKTSDDAAVPLFRTELYTTETIDSATKWKYEVLDVKTTPDNKKDTLKIGLFSYRTGKRYRIQVSAGLTYTFQQTSQNVVSDANGNIAITTTKEQYGVAAALHFYPIGKGVFLQDKSFFGSSWRNVGSRINIMAGLDFRKVPDNLYFGIGYDFGPGIRVNTGVHLYKYTKYEIANNQIVDQSITYKAAAPFLYLGIDPFILINVFKK